MAIIGLDEAIDALEMEGVIAIPTDTVYGLACSAASVSAVERIYEIKERPKSLELTLMVAAVRDADPFVVWNQDARRLADAFLPGALALILPVRAPNPLAIPRAGQTLAVRVPDHEVIRALCSRSGPIATTSANRHGHEPETDADNVNAALGNMLDGVLEGSCQAGRPSTIMECTEMPFRLVREGPISRNQIEAVLGRPTA